MTGPPPLHRRLLAELLGSAFLAALVIAAQQLSPTTPGLSCSARDAATVVLPHAS